MAKFNKFSVLVIILISGFKLGLAAEESTAKHCILPLKPDWSFFSPLIFSLNGTLITTENRSEELQDISLNAGDEVILSCAPNFFRDFQSEKFLKAVCKEDKILLVNNEEKDFVSELSCEVRAIEEIITPVAGCPVKERSVEYGYTNPIKNQSFVLGEACYSTKNGRTIFAHTKVKSANNEVAELAFKVKNDNYFRQEHPTFFYKIELMKALRLDELNDRFKRIFGSRNVLKIGNKKFINDILLTHKQYQPVMKLAWNYAVVNDEDELKNMDYLQHDIAGLTLKNVEIYAGTHGILSIKNSEGNQVDVYLKDNKFPVPKYIWYVVKSENKATAFAILNRGQVSEKDKHICTSKCEEISWIKTLLENKQYKKVENGLVYCCEFNEFKRVVTEMPALNNINDLLK